MLPKRHLSHVQGYLGLGMIAEAAAEYELIPAEHRATPEAQALHLAVLHEQQDWPAVRDLAGVLVRRTPKDAELWVTWAYATRRADSLEAAEKILLEAEKKHPADATIQFNLGCYACQRGDLRAARRRVDCAIGLEPNFAKSAATDCDLAPLRAAAATEGQSGD
ncbi:MAG: hypothetical protein EXS37_19625 [Opitutus sp.]|nr:hypothetical protein [Opitutus sp.]